MSSIMTSYSHDEEWDHREKLLDSWSLRDIFLHKPTGPAGVRNYWLLWYTSIKGDLRDNYLIRRPLPNGLSGWWLRWRKTFLTDDRGRQDSRTTKRIKHSTTALSSSLNHRLVITSYTSPFAIPCLPYPVYNNCCLRSLPYLDSFLFTSWCAATVVVYFLQFLN